MNLRDKTVLVTGGSKGIGRAIVESMAKEGANVIISYNSDESAANEIAKEATRYSVKALIVKADITKQDEVDSMFNKIKDNFSRIDILVNNAGTFSEVDNPENIVVFEDIFNTNFLGQVRVTNATINLMGKGKIIFISSVHGRLGNGRPSAIA
jgi:3-oxoacyl-[acyl-carrier protein] reductase